MKQRFVNQKLGKRTSRRMNLQKTKAGEVPQPRAKSPVFTGQNQPGRPG